MFFSLGVCIAIVSSTPVLSSSKLEDHFIVKVYSSCLCFYDIVLSYPTKMFLWKVPSSAMVLLEDGVTSLKPAYPQWVLQTIQLMKVTALATRFTYPPGASAYLRGPV